MENNRWFNDANSTICFLQDIVHIGTKLRNRLLNTAISLLIGNKIVSVSHLKILLNSISKDVHGLVYSDICPDDRQNYASLEKIMKQSVRDALKNHIIDSEGTIEFIRICDEITSSLYDPNLSPSERVFRLWRSTYFLRAWRLFITQSNGHLTISDNFISPNAYECIELNAKNLIILIRKLRDERMSECFVPVVFNSQPCEETFRKMRSLGTTNFTKINFTLLELVHLIGRVELMNDIMYSKLAEEDVRFPRNPMNTASKNEFELPTDIEIKNVIDSACNVALNDAIKFGIRVTTDDIKDCKLKNVRIGLNIDDGQDDDCDENVDLGIASINENISQIRIGNLKDYSDKDVNENSLFVNVTRSNGEMGVARKSTVIWAASNSKEKLSSDRLRRVQKNRTTRRQLEFVDVSMIEKPIYTVDEIKIGDWCLFRDEAENDKFILGNILSFRYMNAKTKKEKQYTYDFAPIFHAENVRGVEVLASWFTMELNGMQQTFEFINCAFINIRRYVASILSNAIQKDTNENICLSQKYLHSIQTELNILCSKRFT